MKTYLKSILSLFAFLLLSLTSQAADGWLTDIDQALKQAKAENKNVLVKFTGSDWCPPCQMIQKAVFSKKEFQEKASKKFVLCIIDYPKADPKISQKNKPLTKKYNVKGFPTMLLLDSEGKEFNRSNPAAFPSVKKMIEELKYQLRRKEML